MFEILGEVLGNVASGGAMGMFGTLLSFWYDSSKEKRAHKQRVELQKIANEYELKLRETDLKIAELEAASVERIEAMEIEDESKARAHEERLAEREAKDATEQRSHDAYMASVNAEQTSTIPPDEKSRLMLVAEFLRKILRPLLTLGFNVESGLIIYWLLTLNGPVSEEVKQIFEVHLFLQSATTLWWFGVRAGPKPKRSAPAGIAPR